MHCPSRNLQFHMLHKGERRMHLDKRSFQLSPTKLCAKTHLTTSELVTFWIHMLHHVLDGISKNILQHLLKYHRSHKSTLNFKAFCKPYKHSIFDNLYIFGTVRPNWIKFIIFFSDHQIKLLSLCVLKYQLLILNVASTAFYVCFWNGEIFSDQEIAP